MLPNQSILFIDDDESLTTVVSHQLRQMGFAVTVANDGTAGLAQFKSQPPDLVLLDFQMPDMHGLQVLKQIRAINADVPVIIGTAYGTVENAVEACQKGADDFLTKPFAKEQLRFVIEKVLRLKNLERENVRLKTELDDRYQFGRIITANPKMKALLELAGRAAHSDAAVLISGESGVGKELLARAIHHNSPRKDAPFVAVNCPSIPETLIESELFGHEKGAFTGATVAKPGKFELAHGGTLLLDEIGDLKLDLQAKLLRVLQEREIERVGGLRTIPVDVRIVAASNQNLANLAAHGQFRLDLFYRLNVIPLHLPPLRERAEDITLLADFFIKKYSDPAKKAIPGFYKKLLTYHWPGNVRELENIIQRACVLSAGAELNEECLILHERDETPVPHHLPAGAGLADLEREAIRQALAQANGNQTKAAQLLNIPRHVLLYRLKKLGIEKVERGVG